MKEIATKCLELPKPIIESGINLINSLIKKPFSLTGGILADQIGVWKWRNRIRIAHKAVAILKEDKLATKILPPSFLLPFLEESGNVDDPDLQEMWAHLLASSIMADSNCHPAYIQILKQLSRDEAVLLALIAKSHFKTEEIYDYNKHEKLFKKRSPDFNKTPYSKLNNKNDLMLYLSHLSFMGLIMPHMDEEVLREKRKDAIKPIIGKRIYIYADVTELGRHFLIACCKHKILFSTPDKEPWRILSNTASMVNDVKDIADSAMELAENAKLEAEEAKEEAEEAKQEAEDAINELNE